MPSSKADSTSGYVSRLELENFKSWRGKHSVGPFHDGFTAVIGSNGAGKSNLMDAISFVTGVKAKRLRGDQLKDLIFDGDQRAEAENRHMKVTMVYCCGKNELPNKSEGDELVFSRSVGFSTPGSTFELGGRRVTYEEYEEMFSRLNILVSARNFLIFQGDVEATAAKSPAELSLFFEQVSGSDAFKEEYEKLLEEKRRLEEDALEKIQQAKEAKAERKEAKEQKEEKDHFEELSQERENVRVELALFQLRVADRAMEAAEKELQSAKESAAEAENVEKAMEQERKQAAAEAARKSREQSKAEDVEQAQSKKTNVKSQEHAKKQEAFNREKKRKKEAEDALKSAKDAMERYKNEIKETQKQITDFESKEKSLEAALKAEEEEELQGQKQLSKEEKEELEKLRVEAEKLNAELKSEENRLVRETEACRGRLALAKTNQKQTETRATEAKTELDLVVSKREKLEQQTIPQQQAKVAELTKKIKDRKAEEDATNADLEKKRAELEHAKQLVNLSKARNAEGKRTKKLEETVKNLARHFPGVRGRMIELVRPTQKKYALAIDTALGKHLDSIVVDRETTAFECMKYLREQRSGTATFLPLDTIEPKPISEEKRRVAQSGGPYRLCIELLEYDASLERAVRFAAGDSMICDTLEDARQLCFSRNVRVKAVTVDGHLISQRGEMTGGAMGDQGRVDRFAESEAAKAKENKERLEKEIAELERKLDSLRAQALMPDGDLVKAETSLKFLQTDLNDTIKSKLPEREKRYKAAKQAQTEATAKVTELEAELASLMSQLDQVRQKIASKEDQVFKDVSGAARIDRRAEEARQQKRADLAELRTQLGKLVGHLKYLESQPREAAVAEAEKTLQSRIDSLAKLEEELKKAKADLDEAEEALKQAEQAKKKATEEAEIAQSALKEIQKRLANASKERTQFLRKVTQSEAEVQKTRQAKSEIVKQAALDGLSLPRKGEKRQEDIPEEGDDDEVEEEEEEGKDASSDEFDYSVLRRSTKATEEDYRKRLEEITKEMEELLPNRGADTRFQEASEKLKITDAHLKEAREAAAAAAAAFEKVRRQRMEAFMGMFNHVSKRIDGVYKALTKRVNAPMGGSAFLALVDSENPFSGGVKFECMPPNKRFRAMEQLSGGEKTVAALALLFAIHSFRPSPFFVMDEVDAALDNDNVERVSNYIRMRSSQHHQQDEEQEEEQRRPKTRTTKGSKGSDEENEDDEEEEGSSSKRRFQCLVISLKDAFYSKAEKLVGVYRDDQTDSSKCLTLDLTQYGE